MKKPLALLSAIIIVIPLTVSAEGKDRSLLLEGGLESLLWFKENFYIEYSDQVTDGCLPQPSRLKDKMEISLRKNGFNIINEKSPVIPQILITTIGYRLNPTSCVVHLQVELTIWEEVKVPFSEGLTWAPIIYQFGSTLLTGSKHTMQSRIEEVVKGFGDDLYLKISRSKDMVSEKFPELLQSYKEFLDFYEKVQNKK